MITVSFEEEEFKHENKLTYDDSISYKRTPTDYYNERALFLGSNTDLLNVKKEIRLIHSKEYSNLQKRLFSYNNRSGSMNISHDKPINYLKELDRISVKMTNKIKGNDFKKMLDKSNLESNIFYRKKKVRKKLDANNDKEFNAEVDRLIKLLPNKYSKNKSTQNLIRKEQAALIVFDAWALEIRLEMQYNEENYHCNCKTRNFFRSNIRFKGEKRTGRKQVWFHYEGPVIGVDENIIIIGHFHTHPLHDPNECNRAKFIDEYEKATTVLTPGFHDNDNLASLHKLLPYFQLYPIKMKDSDGIKIPGEVDLVMPGETNFNNITTSKKLINDEFDIVERTLREYNYIWH